MLITEEEYNKLTPEDRFNYTQVHAVIIEHNTVELQDKLESLGYAKATWTICREPEQRLVATTNGKGKLKRCFYNAGVIHTNRPYRDAIYVDDDEDLFIKYATEILVGKLYKNRIVSNHHA